MSPSTQLNYVPGPHYLNATWLLKLRWVAVIGQLATIAGSAVLFQTQLPMAWAMAIVISLTAASNLFLTVWFKRWRKIDRRLSDPLAPGEATSPLPWDLILGLVLMMDMLSLTALLFTTGGPNNPFYLFFFVNLSLCALMLNRHWTWAINLLTIVCFAGLMFEHHEMEQLDLGLDTIRGRQDFSLLHLGMIVAFATCSSVIVYFMTRLTDELRKQQRELRHAQALRANSEKIEALGTLAAGTAHELATPLSTIAIVARDVEQAFEEHPPNFPGADDVIEDVHLIRSQLDRCRGILDRMSSHAGEMIGESIQPATIEKISNAALEGLIGQGRVQLVLPDSATLETLAVPLDGLSQAMRGLVQNALDADPTDRAVFVRVTRHKDAWIWKIRDQGAGMNREQLSRVNEPFFTTKPPGQGMGLGVFLAENVLRRIGGTVSFESTVGKGTCVTMLLPRQD
ncbi:MAG: two-component system sensor histidine kinase RegB [Mariniblastus sp.]|jgi:two-component system sensor histidine kinase RegB